MGRCTEDNCYFRVNKGDTWWAAYVTTHRALHQSACMGRGRGKEGYMDSVGTVVDMSIRNKTSLESVPGVRSQIGETGFS